jgi:RNA polymerase I-specific transcription initiation factor RRN6
MPRISTDPHFTNASIADLHLAKVGTHNMQLPAHHQVRFASATMLMSDYTVVESLLYSSSSKDYVELEPSWGSKLNNTVSRSHQQGFIVQQDADLGISSGTQSRSRGRRSRQPRRPLRPTDRPVTLTLVAEELQRPVGVSETIEDVLGLASSMLLSTDVDTIAPMRTMGDLYNSELSICDMAEGSAAFEQLIEKASGITPSLDEPDSMDRLPMVVRSVPLPAALGIEDGLERLSLESSYQHMIDQWIGVLSEHVPGRVRLAKAATVRLLSAEIALASRVIRHQPPEAESYGPPANDQQSALTWDLPLRRSQNDSPHVPLGSSNETPQLSALPTPSPTATPSITTISSHPSSFAAPELYRVSKYTSFSRPGPSVLPRPLTKVLSHWKLGADPSDYDWLSTSNRMMKWEETEADNDLTEKERAQMQKRALRHIKRQRKEAAASQAQQLASSQAPAILTASQPERASTMGSARNLVIGSSQSNGMGVAAASQVMPGRFGGKPPPRKKRKSGF